MRGGITQLPSDTTAVISCSTWVKRAFVLLILLINGIEQDFIEKVKN
jgi:hypothetical protein